MKNPTALLAECVLGTFGVKPITTAYDHGLRADTDGCIHFETTAILLT